MFAPYVDTNSRAMALMVLMPIGELKKTEWTMKIRSHTNKHGH